MKQFFQGDKLNANLFSFGLASLQKYISLPLSFERNTPRFTSSAFGGSWYFREVTFGKLYGNFKNKTLAELKNSSTFIKPSLSLLLLASWKALSYFNETWLYYTSEHRLLSAHSTKSGPEISVLYLSKERALIRAESLFVLSIVKAFIRENRTDFTFQ